VKPDRRRTLQPASLDALDEPGQPPIHCVLRVRSGLEQHLDSEGGFLDARRARCRPAPTAVRVLSAEEPGNSPTGGLTAHHVQITVGGEDAGCAVGGVFIIVGVLVAEPEREPGTVGALLAGEVRKAVRDALAVEALKVARAGLREGQPYEGSQSMGRQ